MREERRRKFRERILSYGWHLGEVRLDKLIDLSKLPTYTPEQTIYNSYKLYVYKNSSSSYIRSCSMNKSCYDNSVRRGSSRANIGASIPSAGFISPKLSQLEYYPWKART